MLLSESNIKYIQLKDSSDSDNTFCFRICVNQHIYGYVDFIGNSMFSINRFNLVVLYCAFIDSIRNKSVVHIVCGNTTDLDIDYVNKFKFINTLMYEERLSMYADKFFYSGLLARKTDILLRNASF